MIVEIKIPSPGESVTEVAIGSWLAEDGSFVEKDQEIAEVETDKATLPLISPEGGKLTIGIAAGQKANVGDIACTIDTSVKPPAKQGKAPKVNAEPAGEPAVTSQKTSAPGLQQVKVTPVARSMMGEHNLDVEAIINGLQKITRREVEAVVNSSLRPSGEVSPGEGTTRSLSKTPMSPLRRKLSKRLVAVKNETAMLTTFNEVDMSAVLDIRRKFQQQFQEKHGTKLGLMSFFMKACAEALKQFPRVNSMIAGDDIITPGYIDIAVAVQTDKGLMVPVIRDVQGKNLPQIEKAVGEMAQKARAAKLSVEEMTGGTFTITNGGVFGSMLSTPILNPPQSAILGMHSIVDRPVAIGGKIDIRPIMYVALSYDHRLIDGRDSVSFLVKVKELLESPVNLLLGTDPEKQLLDL
jgi:2-oxoglutarate dehydrogenase E2 component (dihydrolipoamide succinyltransferase)